MYISVLLIPTSILGSISQNNHDHFSDSGSSLIIKVLSVSVVISMSPTLVNDSN
jgi:hypothetical protein